MARAPWDVTREMFLSVEEVRRLLASVHAAVEAAGRAEAGAVATVGRGRRRHAVRARVPHEANGDAARTAAVDRLIVWLLLFTGLRTSEACALRLADARLTRGGGVVGVVGRRERRDVHLPPRVAEMLASYIRDIRPSVIQAARAADPKGPLLVNERGRAYDRTALYRRVVRVLSAAGLGERASVQLLRHTYGYLAYLGTGGNLLFVQRQLGHAHPMITSVYAQFIEEDYGQLAERVGRTVADVR